MKSQVPRTSHSVKFYRIPSTKFVDIVLKIKCGNNLDSASCLFHAFAAETAG